MATEGVETMDDDIRVSSQSVEDLLRDTLRHHEETWSDALKDQFLMETMIELFKSRRRAGWTQDQVAQAIGTTQSAIARWEKDFEGKISLHRLADFALACGMVPKIQFESIDVAKQRMAFCDNVSTDHNVVNFPDHDSSTTAANNFANVNLAG